MNWQFILIGISEIKPPLVQGHICQALSEKQILEECAVGSKRSQQTVWN